MNFKIWHLWPVLDPTFTGGSYKWLQEMERIPPSTSTAKIAQKTCVILLKCDLWLSWPLIIVTFDYRDLWWPDLDTNLCLASLISLIFQQYLHHTLGSTLAEFGSNELNAASPGSQKWNTLFLPLTWPGSDTWPSTGASPRSFVWGDGFMGT